jgi:hypothetical protein
MKKTLRIDFSPLFNKQRKAAPLAIKQAFRDALDLFSEDPTWTWPHDRGHMWEVISPHPSHGF